MDSGFGPVYLRTIDKLRQHIAHGVYRKRLPPELRLARELGVSRGTLRRALASLAAEGLLRTIPGHGTYVVGPAAREGGPQRGLVGMVLPSIVRARAPLLISGAEAVLRAAGYSLLLATSGDDRELQAEQIERVVLQGANGLILYVVDDTLDLPELRRLGAERCPVVLIDRHVPGLEVDSVAMDNLSAAFLAVQHLVTLGYRRIGYVGTTNLATSSIVERMAGFRWAMHAHGLPVHEQLVCTGLHRLNSWPPDEADRASAEQNQAILRELLGRGRPEALYACNDHVAYEVMEAARSLGLRVPDDLAIVGCDNIPSEDRRLAPLTTVEQPREGIGALAAKLLLERLAGRRDRPERVLLPGRLIVRESANERARRPDGAALALTGSRGNAGAATERSVP